MLLQGHIAATSPTFGHTLPSVFPEPSKFIPDRFKQDPNIKVSACFLCVDKELCPSEQVTVLFNSKLSFVVTADMT